MSGTLPPLEKVTADNHGPYVIITDYILMFLTIIFVVIRLVARYVTGRILRLDDFFLMTATVLLIAQSIIIQQASDNGLGQHRHKLSQQSFDSYSKYNYASQMLSVGVLATSKISITLLIESIQPQRYVLHACRVLLGVIGLWAVSSIIALACQCDFPHPWDFTNGRCINQSGLYYSIGVINILTDVAIVALPIVTMWTVQVSQQKRWLVNSLFAVRLLVVAATIVQLSQYSQYFNSKDMTWHNVYPSIWNQVVLNLSLLTACIPSLKRVLGEFSTGLTGITISDHHMLNTSNQSQTGSQAKFSRHGGRSLFRYGHNVDPRSGNLSQISSTSRVGGFGEKRFNQSRNYSRGGNVKDIEEEDRSESIKGLTDDAIMQTIDYRVDYDGDDRSGHRR